MPEVSIRFPRWVDDEESKPEGTAVSEPEGTVTGGTEDTTEGEETETKNKDNTELSQVGEDTSMES